LEFDGDFGIAPVSRSAAFWLRTGLKFGASLGHSSSSEAKPESSGAARI
jgi:hypothetical protein